MPRRSQPINDHQRKVLRVMARSDARKAARAFGMHESTIRNLKARFKDVYDLEVAAFVDEVVAAYRSGLFLDEMSKKFKISAPVISRIIKRELKVTGRIPLTRSPRVRVKDQQTGETRKIERAEKPKPYLSAEEVYRKRQSALRYAAKGLGLHEITYRVGSVSSDTIQRWLNEAQSAS